jgi:hypothetical protein
MYLSWGRYLAVNRRVRSPAADSDAIRSARVPNLKALSDLRRILGQSMRAAELKYDGPGSKLQSRLLMVRARSPCKRFAFVASETRCPLSRLALRTAAAAKRQLLLQARRRTRDCATPRRRSGRRTAAGRFRFDPRKVPALVIPLAVFRPHQIQPIVVRVSPCHVPLF